MPPSSTLRALIPLIAWFVYAQAAGATDEEVTPARVDIPRMRTSIYVGTVSLETSTFVREAELWSATYDARVFPWVFWSEHGTISIRLSDTDFGRLLQGDTVEFAGDARNHKGKPRDVTGRATPEGPAGGRIKVRIGVDDVELVFNGSYTLDRTP